MPYRTTASIDGQDYPLEFENEPTQGDIDYVLGQLTEAHNGNPSEFGSFGRSVARGVLPAAAGTALASAGAGAAEGMEFGPAGVIAGGLIGGTAGMLGMGAGQRTLADYVDPSSSNPFSSASEQQDVSTNPKSSFLGDVAIFKPSLSNVFGAFKAAGSAEGRQLAAKGYQILKDTQSLGKAERIAAREAPDAKRAIEYLHNASNVAANTGIGAGMATLQGQDPEHIIMAAAQGSLFNDSWLHGGEGHPLDNPKDAEAHANLSKVEQSDQEFSPKVIQAAETLDDPKSTALAPATTQVAAEAFTKAISKAHAEQTQKITEALKPLAETPKEEAPPTSPPESQSTEQEAVTTTPETKPEEPQDNAIQEQGPSSVLQPPQKGTPETGSGRGGVEQIQQGEETPRAQEKIVSATYTDDNGVVHEAPTHIEAAAKAGVVAPPEPEDRETDQYKFMKEDANGKRTEISRMMAARLAKKNGQLKEGERIRRKRLHSNQIEMPDSLINENDTELNSGASEPPSAVPTLPEDSNVLAEPQEGKKAPPTDEAPSPLVDKVKEWNAKRLEGGEPEDVKKALSKWTPEVYEAVRKYGESENRADLSQLSSIQRAHVEMAYNDLHGVHETPSMPPLSFASDPVRPSMMSRSSEGPIRQITQAHVSKAKEILQRTAIGRKLLKGANIVPDWERVLSHPDNKGRNFSAHEINVIKQSQGFHDPETGKSWVIRDNIQLKPGETPEQSVARVLMHEKIGHDGMAWMRANDPEFEKLYHEIAAQIPKAELDAIAERYGHDPVQDKDRTIGEWFAQNVEKLKPGELPEPKSAFGRMWQAVKDWLSRTFRGTKATDQGVRGLAAAIAHSDLALEPRKGPGGEVEPGRAVREGAVVTPQEDRAYLDAVAKGDTETAQRMVDEAAKRAGYNIGPVFHGTNKQFTTFEAQKSGLPAFYFSFRPEYAESYALGGDSIRAFLKADNIYRTTAIDASRVDGDMIKNLRRRGFDAVAPEGGDHEIAVFDPSQIKSADPITRDANGRVIPLSERFNPKSNDIRFSLQPSLKETLDDVAHDMKKAWGEVGESIRDTALSFGRFTKSSPERRDISGTFDSANNKAGYIAGQSGNSVEQAAKDSGVGVSDPAMIASTFVRTIRDDTGGKDGMLERIDEIERRGLEATMDYRGRARVGKEAIKLLRTKWDEFAAPSMAAKEGTDTAYHAFIGEGGKLEYREAFVKGSYIDPESGKFVFDEKTPSGGSGSFKEQKTYNDPSEAILAGEIPKDLRLNKLTESAVLATMKAANRLKWQNSLENFKMPDGKPVLKSIPPDGRLPEGYKSVNIAPGRVVAIHEEMAPTIKALTSETSVPALISKSAAFLKHNTLIFDLFHLARVGQFQAAFERAWPSYRKGLALMEYADKDLASAVRHGDITQEQADWARTNRPKIEALMDHGLNAGKISDALFAEAVPLIPLAKQTNNFIFQNFSRGVIVQSAVHALDRNAKLHPEWTPEQLHKNTAREVNTYYRNLGSQGIFKSKTWQDTARVLAFAPNWVEGMVRSEAVGVGQFAKWPVTGKLGNIGAAMGTGLIASAAVAQLVNMLTRGHPTWENDEPGHGMDAWIPDSLQGSDGYFISPLSVFAETIHDAIKYTQAGENPPSVLTHIAGNKLSPMARTLKTLAMGRDFEGKPLHGMDYFTEAVKSLAPIPLAGRNLSDKGGVERQGLSALGLKADPAKSATANDYAMADAWKSDNGLKQHQITEPSEYAPLRKALQDGDLDKARTEYKKLAKEKKPEVIDKYFRNYPSHPVTGSKDLEEKYVKSLDHGQKAIHNQAKKEKEKISHRFQAMRPYHL